MSSKVNVSWFEHVTCRIKLYLHNEEVDEFTPFLMLKQGLLKKNVFDGISIHLRKNSFGSLVTLQPHL